MGISGLLPQLKPIQQPVTLQRYQGNTLAIDGYAWLHRAAHSCAMELSMNQPTSKYLNFFIKRLDMLRLKYNIVPYLVFDGDSLNVKKETELKRKNKRVEYEKLAQDLWRSGDKRKSYEYFQKCVNITPNMAKCIIDYCKLENIPYIVAPYEADAQMVYLEKIGLVSGIISEDSDLLIFGCQRLITKLNDYGECVEICQKDFHNLPPKFPLHQLNQEERRVLVCLSGCDYTNGIPQIGLLTAIKLVKTYRKIDKILSSIQKNGKYKIPENFFHEFNLANYAFQYQRVFCPKTQKLTTLNEIPQNEIDNKTIYQCIGKAIHKHERSKQIVTDSDNIDHGLHQRIAYGELDPYDFQRILINREKPHQSENKSESSPISKSIDSFFNKMQQSTSPNESKGHTILVGKEDMILEKRKLTTNFELNDSSITSKFFYTNNTVGQDNMFSDNLSLVLDQDDISTEVPSSMIPTQISEDESEILSEIEETMFQKSEPRSNKRRKIDDSFDLTVNSEDISSVRPFKEKRTPLTTKNINSITNFNHLTNSSLTRDVSHDKEIGQPKKSPPDISNTCNNTFSKIKTNSLSRFLYKS